VNLTPSLNDAEIARYKIEEKVGPNPERLSCSAADRLGIYAACHMISSCADAVPQQFWVKG